MAEVEDNSVDMCVNSLLLTDVKTELEGSETEPFAPLRSLVEGWSEEQRRLAIDWAGAVHFAASDNDNEVPPMPSWVGLTQKDHRKGVQ